MVGVRRLLGVNCRVGAVGSGTLAALWTSFEAGAGLSGQGVGVGVKAQQQVLRGVPVPTTLGWRTSGCSLATSASASGREGKKTQQTEPAEGEHQFRNGTKLAPKRSQVHGLGRLAAKLSKPEVDVCKLDARSRPEGSKYETARLRRAGFVPAVLMPHKGTETLGVKRLSLHFKQVESLLSRHKSDFAKAQLIKLRVSSEDFEYLDGWTDVDEEGDPSQTQTHRLIFALIRQFQFDAVTADTVAVSLQRCPPNTLAKLRMPISIIGEDGCSAIKKGGYLYPVRPFVDCTCDSNNIPPFIEYNISQMSIGQSIRIKDLEFQDSIKTLEAKSNDPQETLYKMIKL